MTQLCLPELNALLKSLQQEHALEMLEQFAVANQAAQGDKKSSKPLLDSLRREAGVRSESERPGKQPKGLGMALGMAQR